MSGLGIGVSVLPQVPAMDTDKVYIVPISDQEKEFVRTIYLTYPKIHPISPAAPEGARLYHSKLRAQHLIF